MPRVMIETSKEESTIITYYYDTDTMMMRTYITVNGRTFQGWLREEDQDD